MHRYSQLFNIYTDIFLEYLIISVNIGLERLKKEQHNTALENILYIYTSFMQGK